MKVESEKLKSDKIGLKVKNDRFNLQLLKVIAFFLFIVSLSYLVFNFNDQNLNLSSETQAQTPVSGAPYPQSSVITGITWDNSTNVIRLASGSDNWPITWADDDSLYTAYGDGWGFDPKLPTKLSLGFAKVSGFPPSTSGTNIRSVDEQIGDGASGKKASGMLMINRILYMWVRNADNNGNQCQLAWSTDYGINWTWSNWKFAEFGYCTFINFGKNYSNSRDNYVYSVTPDQPSAYRNANNLAADRFILMRVPVNEITNRNAYEFFTGVDNNGNPLWSLDILKRASVFNNPGRAYRSGISYNAALGRYLWWQVIPDSGSDLRVSGGFGVYDAPEPWGPWTTVYYTEKWDVGPGETGSFPTKWMSSDGKTLYLVFSGDDNFSVRKATLSTTGSAVALYNSHYFTYNNTPVMLLGDSGTQSVMQNGNIDYQDWINEFESKGIKSAMVWAWVAPRQKVDGSVVESRYGYVVPEVMPWQRTGTSTATDGKPTYSLLQLDDNYFNRLIGLCSYMQSKGMVLLITVWDGGAKWANGYHPFWEPNGGPIPSSISGTGTTFRDAFYTFDEYTNSILNEIYSDTWSWQKKNKYFQEKFADRLISEINGSCDNVVYEMTNEGAQVAGYDDFWLSFFKQRTNALLSVNVGYTVTNSNTNSNVDFRNWHTPTFDPAIINSSWKNYFSQTPLKPAINSESVPEFRAGTSPSADDTRKLLWATAVAGGGAFIQDDTVFTDYDPNVADFDGREMRNYMSYINKFFNEGTASVKGAKPKFWEMTPSNSLVTSGTAYALAKSGAEYISYLPSGGSTTLDLSGVTGNFNVEWYNPRSGTYSSAGTTMGGASKTFTSPDTSDWVLYLTSTPTIAPVTISGDRFYSGGSPYFPSTNFLSNGATYKATHVYFSDQLTDTQRAEMLTALKNEGYNSIFLYTINQGDYGSRVVTPYASGIISEGGAFDETKIQNWKTQMQDMISQGLRPILWLFPDDSSTIHNTSTTELKRYIQKMVSSFDDLPVMWVLALEVDEYWTKTKSDDLGSYLKSIAQNPVGLHQLSGKTDYMTSDWVDFGAYQYGFGKSWDTIYNDTLTKKSSLGNKPFLAAEYDVDGGTLAQQRGLAAAFANAAGAGNGAPPTLDEFMATLPDNLTPSRNGSILTLEGNGVIATADMNTLEFSKTDLLPTSPSDLDGDRLVSATDAAILFNNWFTPSTLSADINQDSKVNGSDFSYLKRDWKP
jgi:hypothetical protein